jgi:hypothetical protein
MLRPLKATSLYNNASMHGSIVRRALRWIAIGAVEGRSRTPNFGVPATLLYSERSLGTRWVKNPTILHGTFHGTSLEQNTPEQHETGGKMVHVSA